MDLVSSYPVTEFFCNPAETCIWLMDRTQPNRHTRCNCKAPTQMAANIKSRKHSLRGRLNSLPGFCYEGKSWRPTCYRPGIGKVQQPALYVTKSLKLHAICVCNATLQGRCGSWLAIGWGGVPAFSQQLQRLSKIGGIKRYSHWRAKRKDRQRQC